MSKHLSALMVAVLATSAVLFAAPAFADHRPGNVVVIGGTLGLTGRYAEITEHIYNGRKLYLEELNARGGLLGHVVELRILDDKSDRRTAIELYEKLITGDKVDLIVGPFSSPLTDAVANVMERYKRPFIAPNAASKVIWQRGRKYVFSNPITPTQDYQKGALQLAKKIGVKRIAFITSTDLGSRGKFLGAQRWAKKLGFNVVLVERYRKEQTDFTALLRRIEASGAEAIFSSGYYRDAVAQLRQLRELNINVRLFSAQEGPTLPQFVEELGSTAEYVVGHSSWEPKPSLGHPGMKAFIEKYEKRHGVKPNSAAASGYAVMQITEAAVKRARGFEPEKIRQVLASMAVYTVKGTYKANEQGMSPVESLTFQIRNGKRLLVWPEHAAQTKVLPMPKWEDR